MIETLGIGVLGKLLSNVSYRFCTRNSESGLKNPISPKTPKALKTFSAPQTHSLKPKIRGGRILGLCVLSPAAEDYSTPGLWVVL